MHFHQFNIIYYQVLALEALQNAAESFLIGLLEDANLCYIQANWITILPKDIFHIKRIAGCQI